MASRLTFHAASGLLATTVARGKPFTPFHRTVNWTMRNVPAARKPGIWGDGLLGYEKKNPGQKWWLDLEDVDGVLQVPTSSNKDIID